MISSLHSRSSAITSIFKETQLSNAAISLPTECLTQIFENFDVCDYADLHAALLVSRSWCKVAVAYLWQAPFALENLSMRRQESLISAYIKSLSIDAKQQLITEYDLKLPNPLGIEATAAFNYALFLKDLDMERLFKSVVTWWEESSCEKIGYKQTHVKFLRDPVNQSYTSIINDNDDNYSLNSGDDENTKIPDKDDTNKHDLNNTLADNTDQNQQKSSAEFEDKTGKFQDNIFQETRERERIRQELKMRQIQMTMMTLWRHFYRSSKVHTFRYNTAHTLFPDNMNLISTISHIDSRFFSRVQTLEMGERTPERTFELISSHNCPVIHSLSVKYPVTDQAITALARLVTMQESLEYLCLHGSGGGIRKIVDALQYQLSSLKCVNLYKTHITQSLLITLGNAPNLSLVIFDKCRACFLPDWRPARDITTWRALEKLVAIETDFPEEVLQNIIASAVRTLCGLWVRKHDNRFGGEFNREILEYAKKRCINELISDPDLQPQLQRLVFE
ncbi:9198_t:CDS:1 [Ambispora gerdemannii]|uniref:9198_t:CDS:1 n=1 Tax=Ambispora gerdemannii TaxID=144530 RepID=A0A9N9F845_9GLOM|nr:9198_t:CDS:1 [Ambispora gerdemannii]